MAHPLDIRELIHEPFGPYPEVRILSSKIRKGATLDLTSVYMECAGSPIGLDESEYIIRAPENSRIARNPVHFFGKLKINSLDWLSEQGRKWLEIDLRQRDQEMHSKRSGLTLSRLYGNSKKEGSRITVWIQCEKSMQALFLVEPHPESLILHSKSNNSNLAENNGRRYNIISLDVGTFERSQNFLARYRLWALIDDIIKSDPHNTPLHKRTIDWLVDSYLSRIRERDRFRRHIFDHSDDSDVDDSGNTTRPRYLRHVHRAEVIGLFAAHADWILAQHLASASSAVQKLNVKKWISFCKQVKPNRDDARSNEVLWGYPYGTENNIGNELVDLSQFGETPEFWARRIRRVMNKKKKKLAPNIQSHIDEDTINERQFSRTTFIYDSDFSEASTPPASDSDSDEPPTPSLVSLIPPYCLRKPEIPAGQFHWQCPGCTHTIDLLNLTEENISKIATGVVERSKESHRIWANKEAVQLAFYKMVDIHYRWHMRQKGVELEWKGEKPYLRRHSLNGTSRQTQTTAPVVKVEENHNERFLLVGNRIYGPAINR